MCFSLKTQREFASLSWLPLLWLHFGTTNNKLSRNLLKSSLSNRKQFINTSWIQWNAPNVKLTSLFRVKNSKINTRSCSNAGCKRSRTYQQWLPSTTRYLEINNSVREDNQKSNWTRLRMSVLDQREAVFKNRGIH